MLRDHEEVAKGEQLSVDKDGGGEPAAETSTSLRQVKIKIKNVINDQARLQL